MFSGIEPTLYIDEQALPPKGFCPRCRGGLYGPGCFCLRCGEDRF